MILQPRVGDRVWWYDPDPDPEAPGPRTGTVTDIQHEHAVADTIIYLAMDDGGAVECLRGELVRLDPAADDEFEP